MQTLAYHAFMDENNRGINRCNREIDNLPLAVNCAGTIQTDSAFITDNIDGRLDFYLLYMVKGQLEMTMPCGVQLLKEGDFVLIPPRTPYRYAHGKGAELDYLYVHFTGAQIRECLKRYALACYPEVNRTREEGRIGIRFRQLFDAFSKRDRFRDFEISSLMDRLLICLARQAAEADGGDRQLEASLTYIQSAYNKEITVASLAKMENLSVSRYNDLFRQVMGTSPIEYVIQLRMASACELLDMTNLSVKEIGLSVGYRDSHFFSRIFKKRMGASPTEYRKA